MGNTIQNIAESIQEATSPKRDWNISKLQAAACILASAGLTIGMVIWAIQAFFL